MVRNEQVRSVMWLGPVRCVDNKKAPTPGERPVESPGAGAVCHASNAPLKEVRESRRWSLPERFRHPATDPYLSLYLVRSQGLF